jgi:hypothetical protein
MVCGELEQYLHSVADVFGGRCDIIWLRTRHSEVMRAFFET